MQPPAHRKSVLTYLQPRSSTEAARQIVDLVAPRRFATQSSTSPDAPSPPGYVQHLYAVMGTIRKPADASMPATLSARTLPRL